MPIQGLVELDDPKNLEDFINQIINMYFKATDVRTKESCLSVYMAFRDHYPSYLKSINLEKIKVLNDEIEKNIVQKTGHFSNVYELGLNLFY